MAATPLADHHRHRRGRPRRAISRVRLPRSRRRRSSSAARGISPLPRRCPPVADLAEPDRAGLPDDPRPTRPADLRAGDRRSLPFRRRGRARAPRRRPRRSLCFPQVSAFSLAAARLGWSLPECDCVSLHGRAAGANHSPPPAGRPHPRAVMGWVDPGTARRSPERSAASALRR